MKKEAEGNDVFFNGRFIGSVENANDFTRKIKEKRRSGEFPIELSVRYNSQYNNIMLSTEVGRVLRPLIVVENGKSKLTEEHMNLLRDVNSKWNDLIKWDNRIS